MIFIISLPGVATADVRYKWLASGTLGSAQSSGITQIGTFPMFRISCTPPSGAEELIAYDVGDASNYSIGHYPQSAAGVWNELMKDHSIPGSAAFMVRWTATKQRGQ